MSEYAFFFERSISRFLLCVCRILNAFLSWIQQKLPFYLHISRLLTICKNTCIISFFTKLFQRFTPNVQMKRIYTSLGIYSGTTKYPVLGKFWIRFLNRHLVQRGSLFSRRCTMKALESGKKQLNYSLLPITCCWEISSVMCDRSAISFPCS